MGPALLTKRMTTEEMLTMPADGMSRWLIDGELKETPMTVRNRVHSEIMATISMILGVWLRTLPHPRGRIVSGEAGIILARNPDTTVGVDIAYISAETIAAQSDESTLIEGVPVLIVEIQSPSDRLDEIHEKNAKYRRAGVPLVWIVNPYDQTVVVHRLGAKPQLFNTDQELAAEPQLPGFRVAVAELFAG
jgi:Uma2 family endonuclease